jgi:hypothetical protein
VYSRRIVRSQQVFQCVESSVMLGPEGRTRAYRHYAGERSLYMSGTDLHVPSMQLDL